jgi:hypothetical protein
VAEAGAEGGLAGTRRRPTPRLDDAHGEPPRRRRRGRWGEEVVEDAEAKEPAGHTEPTHLEP